MKNINSPFFDNSEFKNPPKFELLQARAKILKSKKKISAINAFYNPPPLSLLQTITEKKKHEEEDAKEELPPPINDLIEIERKKKINKNMLKLWAHALSNPLMDNPPPLDLLLDI